MRNIVITGFMGTGKTAVGRAVAKLLQRGFVDTDEKIETATGKKVSEIFARDGQQAFRRMEHTVCRELSIRQGLVIATGGGTLINHENRELMMKNGTIICLTASAEEIVRRLGHTDTSKRPLLNASDLQGTIEMLLQARSETYRSFQWLIDTTNLSIKEATDRVISIAQERTIPVRYPGGKYEIRIGAGLLDSMGGILKTEVTGRVAIVTNTVVSPLYAATLEGSLRDAGLDPFTCVIPDGEINKRMSTVQSLYEQLLASGLDRSGMVLTKRRYTTT